MVLKPCSKPPARRAPDADPVDALVRVEALVLHREDRVPHRFRHRREGHHLGLCAGEVRDELAVAVDDQRSTAALTRRERAHVGAAAPPTRAPGVHPTREDHDRGCPEHKAYCALCLDRLSDRRCCLFAAHL
jgi:hypothetical protein